MGDYQEVQLVGGPLDGTTAVVKTRSDRLVYPVLRPAVTTMNLIEPTVASPDFSELVYVRSHREDAEGRPVFKHQG